MNRKRFIFTQGTGSVLMTRDDIVNQLIAPPGGKSIDELTLGERGYFYTCDKGYLIPITRGNDDDSIAYGPFLTAKEYELAAAHLRQAMEELRLAAHYVEGDPPLGSGVAAIRDKINDMREAFLKLKTQAEAPQPTKAI